MTGISACLRDLSDILPCLVELPNGEKVVSLKEGMVHLGGGLKLHHVLFVPKLKYNLASVLQLLRDSNLILLITNNICTIRDLNSRRLVEADE